MARLIFSREELSRFCVDVFVKVGVPRGDAEVVADHLVTASLRGVDSHGVVRIPFYVEGIKKSLVVARPSIRVLRESPVSALVDGGGGLGVVVAARATSMALEKARRSGVGFVAVRNLGHVGMLAYYTMRIAREGMVGFAVANGPALVAPWGGAERVFGTNPLSYAFPRRSGGAIVLDIATSAMASFRIRLAAMRGERIPEGVALDKEGNPTTDPGEALEGVLLPFGAHKGYGFSLLAELVAVAIAGGLTSKEVVLHPSTQGGFFVAALNPTIFRDPEEFLEDVEKVVKIVKSTRPAKGFREVLLPGEKEEKVYQERLRSGIPVDEEVWRSCLLYTSPSPRDLSTSRMPSSA